jgi:endonuclease/exonuclease/phosphatase (EEP) superfamily protein YafD
VTTLSAIVWILSLLLIALTLLPLVRSPRWWIRVWDYPRLQLAIGLAIMLAAQGVIVYAASSDVSRAMLALAVITATACAWQAFSIWPYTRVHRVQSLPARQMDNENTISVLVTNVLQDNRNASGLLDIVNEMDPDILIAVETNSWWDAQLAALSARFPFNVRVPLENTYGMHVFSRLELRDACVRELVTPGIPSVRASVRLRSGKECEIYAVHPEPPLPHKDVEQRDAELLLIAREAKQRRRPTLVAGDLNDVAWSHTTRLFQRISGLLDPRVGRGIFATFHTSHWLVRWPLDHLFHDPSFRLVDIKVLRSYGSDHFPIYASLIHDPTAVAAAPKPRADGADQKEASEKIAEGATAGSQQEA